VLESREARLVTRLERSSLPRDHLDHGMFFLLARAERLRHGQTAVIPSPGAVL
jgi:hypothetical protein